MNEFLHALMRLLVSVVSLVVPGQLDRFHRRRMEDLYSTNLKDDALLSARETGGIRRREIHEIGPIASLDGGVAWDADDLTYTDRDGIETRLVHRTAMRCDCGSAIGYGNESNLLGACQVCARIICQREGCGGRCERCGVLVCRRHLVTYKDRGYCMAHRFYAWWRLFWGYE